MDNHRTVLKGDMSDAELNRRRLRVALWFGVGFGSVAIVGGLLLIVTGRSVPSGIAGVVLGLLFIFLSITALRRRMSKSASGPGK